MESLRSVCPAVAAIAFFGVASIQSSVAQTYPQKPVRFIVPYTAGGPSDVVGRMIGDRLTEVLGKQVIVDNRGGANGNIGMELAAKSDPDGHTIIFATGFTLTLNPHVYRLSYNVERDFAPITQLVSSAALLAVSSTLPAKNVSELIILARKRPGELTFGSSGIGGFGHISGEIFKMLTNTKMIHVPYKSSAPALTDLAAGNIALIFNNLVTTIPMVQAGRIRALAVTTTKRSPALPAVPTLSEAGVPNYESTTWNGLLTRAGVSKEIINRLNAEVVKILQSQDVSSRIETGGAEVIPSTPEELATRIKVETIRMGKIADFAGLKPR
ncbi:MAG: tripartite tricarboxylate transporter substrate binding protein [Burkholderiales bacterium]|nr:tripartite tricarboxylate transporter substrate binding protein [Burkholderiales bacterium]